MERTPLEDEMKTEQMIHRTKQLSLDVITLVEAIPKGRTTGIIAKQILRSATSVGANYRAAQRGRSKREFSAKLGIVLEECDETLFWLELLEATGLGPLERIRALLNEAGQLTSILSAANRSASPRQV